MKLGLKYSVDPPRSLKYHPRLRLLHDLPRLQCYSCGKQGVFGGIYSKNALAGRSRFSYTSLPLPRPTVLYAWSLECPYHLSCILSFIRVSCSYVREIGSYAIDYLSPRGLRLTQFHK